MNVPITQIKPNPKNPRVIKDANFEKLKRSIQEFPEMLEKRPLVCYTDTDGKLVVLGGNMRLKAAKELKIAELPVILADDWTAEQKAEFLVKDNVGFGEWNWEELQSEWDTEQLEQWGVDLPKFATGEDIDLDSFFEENNEPKEQKNKIILEYTQEDYDAVIEAFTKHSGSKEQVIFKLLGL